MSDERQTTQPTSADSNTPPILTLETLGGASLLSVKPGGANALIFGPSKPLALLVYLAAVPGGSATREFLIDLLWADLDPTAARHAFRQTLYYIKQRTGRPLITTTGDSVMLAEPIASDRSAFLDAIEARDFETGTALYRGDFLPNFALPGGLEFEHWLDLERQRLRDTFLRAAEQLARAHLAAARHRDAIQLARRARDTAPLMEQGWRLLLEALISASDALSASLEADALQKLLAEEQRDPEPATQALLRTVRQISNEPTPEGPTAATLVAELVGRETEFSTLLAAWEEARNGTPRHVALGGPAGIGKSRLIADFAARLRARRARLVLVRANPGERDIAYALISKVAAALAELPGAAAVSPASAAALVALNPVLSSTFTAADSDRAEGDEALRRRALAIHELLCMVADEKAVTLVIDDLHWADRESTRVLASVVDGLEHEPVLIVTAARPLGATHQPAGRNSTALRIPPLRVSDIGALLSSIAELPDTPIARQLPESLCRVTNCIPLFVLEMLQLLGERDLLTVENGTWAIHHPDQLREALDAGSALGRRIGTLGDVERAVLQAMAAAGVPRPGGFLADAANQSLSDTAAILHALEVRGMVSHVDDGWEPAHDQIAEAALEQMPTELRAEVERRVARAWRNSKGGDMALRLAGRHFSKGGDEPATIETFVTWTRTLRHAGDRRPSQALAREFLDSDDPTAIRRLARAVPLRYRYGSLRWQIAATVVFVAVASAAATWTLAQRRAPAPDQTFFAMAVDSLNDTTMYRVGIRRDQWMAGDPLLLPRVGQRTRIAFPSIPDNYALAPSGKAWYAGAAVPDSGGDDLMVESFTGQRTRLTWKRGDDVAPDLAPDNSRLVFISGGFDSLQHSQVAIMNLTSGAVRQLTSGSAKAGAPKWSLDGLLIAYGRISFLNGPDSLCIITPDGSFHECYATPGFATVRGWLDSDRLLYRLVSDSTSTLNIFDLRDGSSRQLYSAPLQSVYDVSPDGRWVFCTCASGGGLPPRALMFPTDHPEGARPLVLNAVNPGTVHIAWADRPTRAYVASLKLAVPLEGLPMGAAYQFSVLGVTSAGTQVRVRFATMTSLDTTVLRVLPGNRLLPIRAGSARVVVSAGGWRTDTISVGVHPQRDSTIVSEDWSDGLEHSFVPYGDPRPRIVRDVASDRPALMNNGDDTFESGAYSRVRLDATNGIGVETTISAPATLDQWQNESVAIVPVLDSIALDHWDRITKIMPIGALAVARACSLTYPSQEGAKGRNRVAIGDQSNDVVGVSGASPSSGRWFRVRLQLFPDGRCGAAIDGHPVTILHDRRLANARYIVFIAGQSYRSRVLTGPVEIWTGIKPGVDWLGFDTVRTSRGTARQ